MSCPFCGAPDGAQVCGRCGKDALAARRPCAACGRMTPAADAACMHCGAVATSELRWKIPLIVAMFVAAFVLSVVLAAVR